MLAAVLLTIALPSYVGCSTDQRFQLLGPKRGEVAPTNTAIWFLESVIADEMGRPQLIDLDGGAVDAIELTVPLRNGILIELRPTAELSPSHRYAIVIPGFDPIEFTTDLGADRVRPPMPELFESEERAPLAHCLLGASIYLHTETSESGDLMLATTARDGDVAVARDDDLLVPAAEGERLALSVVAMDLAGNRSPKTLPIQTMAGGCRAISGGDALALALLPICLLAKRRKR